MTGKRTVGWPYKDEFKCHRCGNCCRGDGYVGMTEAEIDRAARFLGISVLRFLGEFCQKTKSGGWELRSKDDLLKSCIFLFEDEEGLAGCQIHGAKPDQCASFPFTWRPKDAVEYCAGLRALEGLETPPRRKTMSRDE